MCDELSDLTKFQSSALCAYCLEACLPVVEHFGTPETFKVMVDAAKFAWASLSVARAEADVIIYIERLELAPETACDDSEQPQYYAMRAIGIGVEALSAFMSDEPSVSAKHTCDALLNLVGDCDAIVRGTSKLIPAGSVREEGPLETTVLSSLMRVVRTLETPPTSNLVAPLCAEARSLAIILLPTLRTVSSSCGWT